MGVILSAPTRFAYANPLVPPISSMRRDARSARFVLTDREVGEVCSNKSVSLENTHNGVHGATSDFFQNL